MSAAFNPRGGDGPAAVPYDTLAELVRAAVVSALLRGCDCEPDIALYESSYVRVEHDDGCPALAGAA